MSDVALDWSSAEVRDGKLEVPLEGELPDGWKDSFERTVALLAGGEWGKVGLKKDRVRVHDVTEGSEDRLRHFLESVVLQANADHEPAEDDSNEDGEDDEAAGDEAEGDEADRVDAELTKRFRSFASGDEA